MSWYSNNYAYRWPVCVDNSSGGTSPVDIAFTIPPELSEFWDEVQADGDDVRVCSADGRTLLTYHLASWTYATRTGVVEIDNWTPPAASSLCVIWLYWGNAAATNAEGSFTASSALTGRMYPARTAGGVFGGKAEPPGLQNPSQRAAKTSDAVIMPWVDVTPLLANLPAAYEGHDEYEEISHVDFEVLAAGTDQTSERTLSQIRFLGRGLIRGHHTGGADGNDRTLSWVVTTTEGRAFNPRIQLSVVDVDEQ